MALSVADLAASTGLVQAVGLTYPVLADPTHQMAEAYGVYNLLGDGLATPSIFVVDQEGHIVWSYVGQNANDRPSNEAILEHLP